jgi:hypothetical protein
MGMDSSCSLRLSRPINTRSNDAWPNGCRTANRALSFGDPTDATQGGAALSGLRKTPRRTAVSGLCLGELCVHHPLGSRSRRTATPQAETAVVRGVDGLCHAGRCRCAAVEEGSSGETERDRPERDRFGRMDLEAEQTRGGCHLLATDHAYREGPASLRPMSSSNIARVCCAACKSQPIILISASFDPSAVRVDPTQSTQGVARPTSL